MNYKGITFENSIDGWKEWLNEFPNPFDAEEAFQKVYHWHNDGEDYYIALTIADSPGGSFLGVTIRRYSEGDFVVISEEEEDNVRDHFSNHIERYMDKFGLEV